MEKLKIDKPIRLIELFSGIGAQAKALTKLGADFEHYRTSEWEWNAVASYKAIHKDNDTTDYSTGFTKDELTEILFGLGISTDGKKPMSKKEIARKGEEWKRTAYNNFKATNNIGSILNINGNDLGIVDTDKYCYIMTYSFPCQDLSLAGKGKGMAKGENTRSSLLWEVERLLNECVELPQILLMENVTQVHGTKNKEHFDEWLAFLESKGYSNYWKDLNAKNFGIPQNRNRCFMVSMLGEYSYEFPKEFPLMLRLKDMLEDSVDEKFYISSEKINKIANSTFAQEKAMIQKTDVCGTLLARDYKDPKCVEVEPVRLGGLYDTETSRHQAGAIWDKGAVAPTVDTMQGGNRQPLITIEPTIQKVDIPQTVRVRKHPVDTDKLVQTLREHKLFSNKEIAEILNVPLTKVEHWFRTDDCFAIPDAKIWFELKALLGIETNEFDAAITTFEEKEGVFEKSNRCYFSNGIAPTLTRTSADEKIIEPLAYDEQNGYVRKDGTVGTLTTDGSSPKHNNRVIIPANNKKGYDEAVEGDTINLEQPNSKTRRGRVGHGVAQTLNTATSQVVVEAQTQMRIRKLTPKECWRLMGFDDADFDKAAQHNSNTQLYKQAGNSIVVDVLFYIFKQML